MNTRSIARVAFAFALIACAGVEAQTYPQRPVRIVVPFGPGGATDIVARSLAQKFSEAWNQSVVVDNRGGAGGIIGSDLVAKATADGHTLLLATAANAANVVFEPKLPFDLVKDFAPVSHIVNVPFVLTANPKVPANTVQDLVAYARTRPGQLNYGTVGLGTSNHLMMELLKSMSGTDILHIPYKGVGPALVDLMGGRVNMMLFSIGAALPYLKDGRLKAIAVTSGKRADALPNVPAISETLPGYDMTPWYGLLAPARTPQGAIDRVNGEILRILKQPDVLESYAVQGFVPVGSTPAQFSTHIREMIAKYQRIVRDAKIKIE
jgi:tripartite-type tricarboxylate transporter receptor subunit TctC